MAINDISLTTGMRSNLLSLQNTVSLLDRTQSRLSSGKKVNTAMDNPVSFFAAQALNSRASIIDGLKDAMGQAVQTITAADKGITAISAMIEQAKGLAQSAMSAEAGTTTAAVPAINSSATLTVGAVAVDETIVIGGVTFQNTNAVIGGGVITYDGSAADLAAKINASSLTAAGVGYNAVAGDGTIALTNNEETITAAASSANHITVGAITAFIPAVPAVYTASPELTTLQNQYNAMLTQISDLASDSGYKGKNLLAADTTLSVKFEGTHKLDITGFDASATAGLGITAATWTTAGTGMEGDVTKLDAALTTLRSESSKLSGNLSIISVRQDFSTNMINTLNAGADKLTMADTNEEGANMLMLQTRQSLSTTALSLSAQAAQSVLKLFG